MRIDHVTGVFPDVDAAAAVFERLTGRDPMPVLDNDRMSVRTIGLGDAELHLVSLRNDDGEPVPSGLHHVALRVGDLDKTLAELAQRGFSAAGKPVRTAPGIREVFLTPETTAGLLVQLVERTGPAGEPADLELDHDGVHQLTRQTSGTGPSDDTC
jgi:hypothetical protein